MGKTQVKSRTEMSTKVGIAVAVVMLAAALATAGSKVVGNFAATTVKHPGCIDSDGVDYALKGTVKDVGVTLDDSCKDAKTLNEAICDPIRKYAGSVTHTCINGCNAGKCNPVVLTSSAPIINITKSDFYIPPTNDTLLKAWFEFNITAQSQDVYIPIRTTSTFEYLVNKNNAVLWQTPIAGVNQSLIVYTIDKAGTSTPGFHKITKGQTLNGRAYFNLESEKTDGSFIPTGYYSVSLKSVSYKNSPTATAFQKVELLDTSKATTKSQAYPSLPRPVYNE